MAMSPNKDHETIDDIDVDEPHDAAEDPGDVRPPLAGSITVDEGVYFVTGLHLNAS